MHRSGSPRPHPPADLRRGNSNQPGGWLAVEDDPANRTDGAMASAATDIRFPPCSTPPTTSPRGASCSAGAPCWWPSSSCGSTPRSWRLPAPSTTGAPWRSSPAAPTAPGSSRPHLGMLIVKHNQCTSIWCVLTWRCVTLRALLRTGWGFRIRSSGDTRFSASRIASPWWLLLLHHLLRYVRTVFFW